MVHGLGCQTGDLVGVPLDKGTISQPALSEAHAGDFQQLAVDVDRNDVRSDFRDLRGEPAVTSAQVDHGHAWRNAGLGEYIYRIGPKGFPPARLRHPCAFEESGLI